MPQKLQLHLQTHQVKKPVLQVVIDIWKLQELCRILNQYKLSGISANEQLSKTQNIPLVLNQTSIA